MGIILLISVIIYVVAGISIYHNIYSLEKSQRIAFISIAFIVIFIITVIICSISTLYANIENVEHMKIVRNTSILLAAPINSMMIIPYLGNLLNKCKLEIITKEQFKIRLAVSIVISMIIIILEIGYIKNFELGLIQSTIRN